MIDLTKKYKRKGIPVEVGVIGGVLISVDGAGNLHTYNADGTCIYDTCCDLIPYNEWEDFKEGEPVMVRNYDHQPWVPMYFAGIMDGFPTAYCGGGTKWSSKGHTDAWNFCRRPTKEELANSSLET